MQLQQTKNDGEEKEENPSTPPSLSSKQEPEDDRFSYPPSVLPVNLSREIDYFSPDYYDQMLLIRKQIAERQSVVPSLVHHLQEV